MTAPTGNTAGFHKRLFYGPPGSSAGTRITNAVDATYENGIDTGDTTRDGDGDAPPIATEQVTRRTVSLTLTMRRRTDDATLTAMISAATGGTLIAYRHHDYEGAPGFNGDVNVSMSREASQTDTQNVTFTLTPNDDIRTPALNAAYA